MGFARIVGTVGLIVALVPGFAAGAAAKSKSSRTKSSSSKSSSETTVTAIGSYDEVAAAQIAATAATDIRAALALVPSLVIDDTGGASGLVTISLRGSNARQVLVLVDGHRVGNPPSGPFNLNDLAFPVERIKRIEVIASPVSLGYGPDAIGGVVNIVTTSPGATPAIKVSYGRGAEAEQRIAGGLQFGFKKLGLRLDGQWLTGDGFRDNGDFDSKSFKLGAAVAATPWGLDVNWTSLARESGVPGPTAHPSPNARRKDARDGLRADVVYQNDSSWDLKGGFFTRSQTLRYTDPAPPVIDTEVASEAIDSRYESSSYGVEAQLEFDTKQGELYTLGAEWAYDRFEDDSDEKRTAKHWSLYTQDKWRADEWSAVVALRRDQFTEFGGRTKPSLSIGWGSGAWKLWTAWSKNFRVPSFDELYWDEQFVKGNPDLEMETSESYDGGIEMGGAGGRVRLSSFRRKVKNYITWTDADDDTVYQPENVSRVTVKGWEAEVMYRPSATISIPVGYQRLSTKDGSTGESLPGAVRGLWRAAVQGTGTALTWSLEYVLTDRGEYRQSEGAWKYAVVNAALSWQKELASVPFQVSVRAENLQDRDYETVEGYPMRGRSWYAEVKVGW